MSFGNLHYSILFSPYLACVSQLGFSMGVKTTEMLLNKIDRDYYLPSDKNEIILPTKIVFRETAF